VRRVINFTNCCERDLPFKYLGLPVGANSKSISENLWRNLVSWGNHDSFVFS
jgi:hypothetical protein